VAWSSGAEAHGGVKGGPEVRPEGMRGAEGTEHRSTLDADGGRRYGALEVGPGGSCRIKTGFEYIRPRPRAINGTFEPA
jgi:hypothetical protein